MIKEILKVYLNSVNLKSYLYIVIFSKVKAKKKKRVLLKKKKQIFIEEERVEVCGDECP